jgi:hypothetical protein
MNLSHLIFLKKNDNLWQCRGGGEVEIGEKDGVERIRKKDVDVVDGSRESRCDLVL